MADAMGRESLLPTIKCSSCGAEIQISMMGDHLCSTAPQPSSSPEHGFRFKDTPPLSSRPNRSGSDSLKPARTAPPRIDPQVANRPFMRQDQLTPISNSDSHNVSSITPFPNPFHTFSSTPPRSLTDPTPGPESSLPDERRAPFPAPSRIATSTIPRSPEFESNPESAFPSFPPRTPRTPPKEPRAVREKDRTGQLYAEPSPLYAPRSPRKTGGGSVLQRMNTIVPGPFGVQNAQAPGSEQPGDNPQSQGHQKNRSSKGNLGPRSAVPHSTLPPDQDEPILHTQRPSTAGSEKSQKRTGFDGSNFRNRNFLDQVTASNWSSRQEAYDNQDGLQPPEIETHSLRPESRSKTLPIEIQSKPLPRRPTDQSYNPFERRPSTSGSLGRSKDADSPFATWGKELPQSRDQEDATYHKPTLSRSSNGSGSGSGSDTRTASSRSTPPTSGTYRKSRRRPSDTSNIDGLLRDIQSTMRLQEPTNAMTKNTQASTSVPQSVGIMPKEPETPGVTRFPGPLGIPMSPRDPRLGGRDIAPKPPKPPMSPMDAPSRGIDNKPPHRRLPATKGNCRGCGEPIKGKSVSSADGRLTGRYHKQCFVCKTCKEPFETATFYILQNNPFCERHYHQLNNSLCHACDQGIEGQYLETERKQKYHKYCFKCHECQTVLRDDYYEHNKQAYCERHALRLVQQSSFLGPGRRNPERRTTRLMTMI